MITDAPLQGKFGVVFLPDKIGTYVPAVVQRGAGRIEPTPKQMEDIIFPAANVGEALRKALHRR